MEKWGKGYKMVKIKHHLRHKREANKLIGIQSISNRIAVEQNKQTDIDQVLCRNMASLEAKQLQMIK